MYSKAYITSKIAELEQMYGEWTNDIPLSYDVWTKKNQKIPHTRLKRIVQIVCDLVNKPISECRILDLGSIDGLFSIEFALHGAEVVGIEIREDNLKKAIFCKEILNLDKLSFIQDDIRNISPESYGIFDAIVCSGVLYHLTADEVFKLTFQMYKMTQRILILDTHISLNGKLSVEHDGKKFFGEIFHELPQGATQDDLAKSKLASWKNFVSFWFTRPSLINILKRAGFSSVYECLVPTHINYGRPGIEHYDRCAFVAVKGTKENILTSPIADETNEDWPEGTLSYIDKSQSSSNSANRPLTVRILTKLKKIFYWNRY